MFNIGYPEEFRENNIRKSVILLLLKNEFFKVIGYIEVGVFANVAGLFIVMEQSKETQ